MEQSHLEFLAGKCIVNPDLSFWIERIPLFISSIKKGIVDLVPHLVTIYNPDIITVFLAPVIAVNAGNAFLLATAAQEGQTNYEKKKEF
jgi:hypothetical protein